MRDLTVRLSAPLIALAILAGCTSHSNYRQGEIASQLGKWDDAVLYYMKAVDNDPANISYKARCCAPRSRPRRSISRRARSSRRRG